MKALLETIPMPVWLRDENQKISWANPAYVTAVDADDVETVCAQNIQLLDASRRMEASQTHDSRSQSQRISHYTSRLPATISGDRRMMDVNEVSYAGGSAGLAVDMNEVEVDKET